MNSAAVSDSPQPLNLTTFGRFYRDHFIKGFCRHLPLPLTMLFLMAGALRVAGNHFGLDYLIWHEEPQQQLLVGFAMSLLVFRIFFLSYLLETQTTPYHERYNFQLGRLHLKPALCHVFGMMVSAFLTLLAVYLILITARAITAGDPGLLLQGVRRWWAEMPDNYGLPFLVGGLLSLLLFIMLLYWPQHFDSWNAKLANLGAWAAHLPLHYGDAAAPAAQDRYLHGVAALYLLLALVFYFVLGMIVPFSPIVFLCFLLDMVLSVYGFIKYFLHRWVAVVVFGLALLFLLGGIPRYKYQFPNLDYDNLQLLADYPARLDPDKQADVFKERSQNLLLKSEDIQFCKPDLGRHKAGQKRPLVIVSTSGGGIRAAAWTVAVLQKIEQELWQQSKETILFPYHVRLVTGASGGMLGASYFTTSLPHPEQYPATAKQGQEYEKKQWQLFENITQDSLTPTVNRLIYGDLGGLFLPWPTSYDRGQALEEAWQEQLGPVFGAKTFADLYEEEKAGWRPSLVFSPMLVEDGRRLLITNLDLLPTVKNDSSILRSDAELALIPTAQGYGKNTLSISAYEFFRVFPDQKTFTTFRLSTAARMSATFPYISPAAPLPTIPRRRVVDAGYFDNYGVSLAAAWLFSASNQMWFEEHVSGIVLIQIRDGLDQQERLMQNLPTQEPSTPFLRGLEELTSPPSGLYSSTTSAAALRNDELLEVVSRTLNKDNDATFFTTIVFELTTDTPEAKPPSLSWYLTSREKQVIEKAVKENSNIKQQAAELFRWWEKRAAFAGPCKENP